MTQEDSESMNLLPDRSGGTAHSPKLDSSFKQHALSAQTKKELKKIEKRKRILDDNKHLIKIVTNKLKSIKSVDAKNIEMIFLTEVMCRKYY